jgi:hypothetical protein
LCLVLLGSLPVAQAKPSSAATATWTLSALQKRHNRVVHDGLLNFRSPQAPAQEWILGDNTDPWGMGWTKCTNLGIHLLSTLVAERRGLLDRAAAKQQIQGVLAILGQLKTSHGIFPENLNISGKEGIRAEVVDGKMRFSSIDSAWVTLALSLVEARYRYEDRALGSAVNELLARQDYRVFVGADGLLGAGFYLDVASDKIAETIAFSYGDRNSEARPLLLALVGLGQLPASAWDNTLYGWSEREGQTLAKGWHYSAFVELTGALFFDEKALAPRSLGTSHQNYVEASVRVARRLGHRLFGYAPACDAHNPYAEFGLDRPDVVSPYAAALLTMTGDPRTYVNFDQLLDGLPRDGSPLADGIDPVSGEVSCGVARTLDQGLIFLALNADVLRSIVRKASFYPSAERRLRAMDRVFQPPAVGLPKAEEQPNIALQVPVPAAAPAASVALASHPQAATSEASPSEK